MNIGSESRHDEFFTLLSQCERRLYGSILSLVQDFHDADDLAQEVRLCLWEQFDRFESGTSFEAWARTVAYYRVLAFREKQTRKKLVFSAELTEKLADKYTQSTAQLSKRHEALLACLERVGGKARKLLQLVYAQGESVKKAASILERPLEGTYKSLARVRVSLQECIQQKLSREEA